MPISEDEFESRVHSSNPLAYHHYHQQQLQMAMSKAEQRKNNKPIMEKKRRARINNCLSELKSLILDAMKKDPARHSKLEKADILEMTVKHLQSVQKQQLSVAMAADPTVVHKFKTGFSECATEVNRFIGRLDGIDAGLKQRLAAHLGSCVTGLQQIAPTTMFPPSTPAMPTPDDLNNNQRLQALSVQLIPSRLPTGEFAFVLPNSSRGGSAFTAVHKDDDAGLLSPESTSSSPVFDAPGHSEVTSTTLEFKIPQRNFNKSLMKNRIVYQSQAAKLRAEEGLLKDLTDFPKEESNYEDKRDLFARSFLTSQKLKPLTVITSEDRGFHPTGKNPLDFSMKRLVESPTIKSEPDLESRPIGLLLPKSLKPELDLKSELDLSQDSGFLKRGHDRSPDEDGPGAKRAKVESSEEDGDSPRPKSESSPLSSSTLSTSTLSTSTLSTSSGSSSVEKDSMWRPW